MFFDQFHETKSRHLSSEPLTALKKQLFKFSWNQSKKFTFTQNFAFYEFKCYFVITPKVFECLHFEIGHRAFLNQCLRPQHMKYFLIDTRIPNYPWIIFFQIRISSKICFKPALPSILNGLQLSQIHTGNHPDSSVYYPDTQIHTATSSSSSALRESELLSKAWNSNCGIYEIVPTTKLF